MVETVKDSSTVISLCFSVVMNESRTSSILRGSRKVTTERDMYMSLWKNYVVMGCCIAPPSILHEPRSMSPDLK